jgi:uncharacterized protein YutE (UPF0331/DUF86 family)
MSGKRTLHDILRNLDTYVGHLRQLSVLSQDQLAADFTILGAAKYSLQTAIECCIDIANHIIARENMRAPQSYADSFAILAEHNLIQTDFVPTARRMVGMRNRLVHLYWEVNADIVYDVLQNYLDDFDRYKADILTYLRQGDDKAQINGGGRGG